MRAGTTVYGAEPASATTPVITHNRAGYVVAGDGAVHRASASGIEPAATSGALRTFANIQVGLTNPPLYRAAFRVTARSDGSRALPLTDFGRATLLRCRVGGPNINLLGVDYVAMETPGGVTKALPLPLQPKGRFQVSWQHH